MAKGFGSQILDSPSLSLRESLGGEERKNRRRAPFLTMWPNGQFSLSYRYRTDSESTSEAEEWSWVKGVGYQRSQPEASPPNLVSTEESSQPVLGEGRKSGKYGLKGITSYGTKMVRSAACLLQDRYGASGLTFMTLTVPSLSREERAAVASGWGDLMRQVIQRLSRLLRRSGQPPLVVSVTELQSSRLKRTRQAYLHAHLVFPARRRGSRSWSVDVGPFRDWFKELIESKIGRPLEILPRVETKLVRKSAEGYLGKYMTKGSEEMQGIVEDLGEECVPGQQWNMSKPMRDWVKKATVRSFAYGDMMQLAIDLQIAGVHEVKGYLRRIEIDIGGRIITTAWVGNIGPPERKRLGLPVLDRYGKISINRNSGEVAG